MSLMEDLRGLGVDVDEGLDRVMGDEATYEMLLGLFIDSVNDNPIRQEEFDEADLEPLIRKIHMFKGVTGNLSIVPLFDGYQEILNLLRSGQAKEAQGDYQRLLDAQAPIVDCLRRYQTA